MSEELSDKLQRSKIGLRGSSPNPNTVSQPLRQKLVCIYRLVLGNG